MNKTLYILMMLLCFTGCNQKLETKSEISNDSKVIAASMKNLDKDSCVLMYKQFAGLSEYMKNAGRSIDSTDKLFKVIESFQKDYGYEKGSSTEYTDAVEQFLSKNGYLFRMNIVDNVSSRNKQKVELENGMMADVPSEIAREKVVSDLRILADAAKIAIGTKNDK